MARATTRLLAAPLALLLVGGVATARAETTTVPAAPPPPVTTTAAAPPTAPAPPPTAATTAAPPPPVATTPVAPPAAGAASATTAVPRVRPHRAHAGRRPVAHAAASGAVTIRDFSFGPATITIDAGETVTWINDGPTDHTATGSGFDTGTLKQGQSASHTFATAGTFSYHCTLHPFMKGTVTVVAPAASTGGSGGTGAATAGATTSAAPTGPSLPRTGGDPAVLAALGAVALLLGCGLRRRSRTRR
ncbi:MAG TPA: cupredoxin family copper-binding protein [Conexibacter sp.]|nr:cupredoxin family copper-binding protein [Conexibacter sp.]